MELVEAEQLPGPGQFGVGICVTGRLRRPSGQELGVVQQELALAIGALGAGLAGVGTTVVFQVKLAIPDRQSLAGLRFEVLEELAGASHPQAWCARVIGQPLTVLQHLAGRPATTVSPAKGSK